MVMCTADREKHTRGDDEAPVVRPRPVGHATFLDEEANKVVAANNTCIEIWLTSNLLSISLSFSYPSSIRIDVDVRGCRCKTAPTLDAHHIGHYLEHGHPIAICMDDVLPFRTSLEAEYALLLAPAPLGLGFLEDEVRTLAEMGMRSRFGAR
ncbi:hypothetical protein DXG01_009116 [Tephrocybe rancida]|nr:hypothetical protein DXG01_009116 [Tephrocybe rancida]